MAYYRLQRMQFHNILRLYSAKVHVLFISSIRYLRAKDFVNLSSGISFFFRNLEVRNMHVKFMMIFSNHPFVTVRIRC